MDAPAKREAVATSGHGVLTVSPLRDRIGRSVVRVFGIAAVLGGAWGAFSVQGILPRVGALITGLSTGFWFFHVARTGAVHGDRRVCRALMSGRLTSAWRWRARPSKVEFDLCAGRLRRLGGRWRARGACARSSSAMR